jgi:hypothetical protein
MIWKKFIYRTKKGNTQYVKALPRNRAIPVRIENMPRYMGLRVRV